MLAKLKRVGRYPAYAQLALWRTVVPLRVRRSGVELGEAGLSPGTTVRLIDFEGQPASLAALLHVVLEDVAKWGAVCVHATYNVSNPLLFRTRWALAHGVVAS